MRGLIIIERTRHERNHEESILFTSFGYLQMKSVK